MGAVLELPTAQTVSFTVDGRRVTCGTHAIARYWERVKPTLPSAAHAAADLQRVAASAGEIMPDAPSWVRATRKPDPQRERPPVCWLRIGDAIAIPLAACNYVAGELFAPTTLAAGGVSDITLAARSSARRARRQERADVRIFLRGNSIARSRTATHRARRLRSDDETASRRRTADWLSDVA